MARRTYIRFWTDALDVPGCIGDESVTGFQVREDDGTWRPARNGASLADVKTWMDANGMAVCDWSPVTSDIRTGEMFVMISLDKASLANPKWWQQWQSIGYTG